MGFGWAPSADSEPQTREPKAKPPLIREDGFIKTGTGVFRCPGPAYMPGGLSSVFSD